MSDFNNQWIEVFHPGDYGPKGKFQAQDLDQMVANFKAGIWTPPFVIGHPQTDAPAHGWVGAMRIGERGALEVKGKQVSAQLEALVKDGRFPNRSVAIYLDPKGTGPVVRHVGFLGAVPPEVKGLTPIQFSDGEFIAIEFNEEDDVDPKELKKTVGESVREFFAELFGTAKPAAAPTLSEDEIHKRVEAATKPLLDKVEALTTEFKESVKTSQKQTAEQSAVARKAEVQTFIEKCKGANHWVPAFDQAGLTAVLEHLAIAGGTVKFGEAGKEKELSPYLILTTFLEQLPAIVPVGELAKAAKRTGKLIQFTEPRGDKTALDAESMTLAEAAAALEADVRKENPKLLPHQVYSEALRRARAAGAGNQPGAIAAGQV